jgi:hypothetical protein
VICQSAPLRTHPLPQVVLTGPNNELRSLIDVGKT